MGRNEEKNKRQKIIEKNMHSKRINFTALHLTVDRHRIKKIFVSKM